MSDVRESLTRGRGLIVGRNAVAKLAASLLIAVPLVVTIDPVSAAVALVLSVPLLVFSGLRPKEFWIRTLPLWIAAPASAVTIALYGAPGGEVLFHWGFVNVSEGSLWLAMATFLRVLAIGLPTVALFAKVDPTDLADALAQIVRLPARFVLGALAGMRMLGLLSDDWRALTLARRARGVADTGRVRHALNTAFALFVLAIRRGSSLATAMEARAFGSPGRRTWARQSRLARADVVLMCAAALIPALALTAAIATGAFRPILAP